MFRLNQFRQIQTKCRLQHDVERIFLSSYLSKLDQFNALVDIMIVADNSKQFCFLTSEVLCGSRSQTAQVRHAKSISMSHRLWPQESISPYPEFEHMKKALKGLLNNFENITVTLKAVTLILVTDVWDEMCWWQIVIDNFKIMVTVLVISVTNI